MLLLRSELQAEWLRVAMDQQPIDEQERWLQERLQAGIDARMRPIEEMIKKLLERTEAASNTQDPPLLTPITGQTREITPEPIQPIRKKPLPNPPKFSGNRREYPAWSQQMRMKIQRDATFYPAAEDMWYLINSCLDTAPAQTVATFVAAGGPGGRYEPTAFMDYLDRTYKDHAAQSRAAAELGRLRQRDTATLASFLPKFERVLSEAGGSEWADNAKITFLKNALNPQLRRSLATAKLPTDYGAWLADIQEIAAQIESLKRPIKQYHSSKELPAPSPRDHEGDIQMANSRKSQHRKDKKKAHHKEPNESSQEDSDRGAPKCYSCGKKGHIARYCKRQPARTKRAIKKQQDNSETLDPASDSAEDLANELKEAL